DYYCMIWNSNVWVF
nr:immunoglobulin light chain junction region [Macaca mulatta]MOV94929.1 immunoglobulin light chain junction region [Macaca mulatta]MOV95227.1 immunoglobulin light chain junction region [Macaca mulatta]MOV97534.1 immunoglobulin light chain junction region [Macaca mulatta]MOV97557.1 immunoglobulin light chain junction region [Macaca mulatta]